MFEDLRNSFDFYMRNKTKFSRKNYVEKNKELIERNRLENLYTKDVLSQIFSKNNFSELNILDIGCKNWFYAKGEFDFFSSFANNFNLDGIEIDPFRLYSNFYSRYEVAKFYIKDLKNTNYIIGNLLDLTKKYDYIIWFLPFVIQEPHVYWGLPKKYFYPEKLLKHAYNLLKYNGEMLIVNQGEEEALKQKELLDKLNLPYRSLGKIESDYFEYRYPRYGFLIKKARQ